MAFQKLLLELADCEARAHGIRKQLIGNPKLGLDFAGIDYIDTLHVKNQLQLGKAALRGLKDLSKALQPLLHYVDYSIYKIQDAVRPLVLHNGLNVIPNDILALIFEKAFESAPGSTRHLASVNRRFRNVALSLPKLWSILPEHSGKEAFDLYLARSRDVGLIVEVELQNVLSWYGKEMMQLTHRWESVSIMHKDIQGINLQSLSCPRAQTIFVEVTYETGYLGRPEDFKIEWKLPALRHIIFRNAMPALPMCVLENLTSLDLRLDNSASYSHFPNGTFLRQLSHMDNLQVLSLSLSCARFEERNPSLLCDLSSLTDFCIELSGGIVINDLRTFLDNINMKSVLRFSAKMDDEILQRELYFPEVLTFIFSTSAHGLRFPNMEAATLLVGPKMEVAGNGNLAIDYVLGHPALKSLHISFADALLLDPQIFKDHKLSLRVVSVIGCNSGVREFLDLLLTHVNPDGTRSSNSIERLRVLGCPKVTMNYLMDFLPEEKIEWSPVVDINFSQ